MILATAGHVDHGKTALVRALTGIDTDRLPAEKARGLSIDLGYAYQENLHDDGITGFVDVPGHERFVSSMLAGVAGVDATLLLVAADDGPMPQTREHLAILDLLEIREGLVVLSKADRVSPSRLQAVESEVRALLARTTLEGCPVLSVSAATGSGIDGLRQAIAALRARTRPAGQVFRLAVDRAFLLHGVGLVVTGTIVSGQVAVGDSLTVAPSGLSVRARSLHAQGQPVQAAQAGQRCAVNIAGATKEAIRRGDWLVAPGSETPTRRLDVRLRLALTETRPLNKETAIHLHLGAADVTGQAVLLDCAELAPGGQALAQIVLEREIEAGQGDPLVLRDQSAWRTLAGGRVVTPFGAARGRAKPERLAWLDAMAEPQAEAALARLLNETGAPLGLHAFQQARKLGSEGVAAAVRAVEMQQVATKAGPVALAPALWQTWYREIPERLAASHAAEPERPGLEAPAVRRMMPVPVPPTALVEALLAALTTEGKIALRVGGYCLPGHAPRLAPAEQALWHGIETHYKAAGRRVPMAHEAAAQLGLEPEAMFALLSRAQRLGLALRVSRNRFILPEALLALARLVEDLANESPTPFTAAAFRDKAGIGRNLAIELLEFFDRRGLTRRDAGGRRLIKPAAAVFGPLDA